MSLSLKPDSAADGKEHYLVKSEGQIVGRIFNRLTGTGVSESGTWFWGLDYLRFIERGCAPPHYGDAETRDEAMARFRATWESGNAA